MAVTQKLYNSYTTKASSTAPNSDFLELLETLPTVYNPNNQTIVNLYRERIIDVFGTDVTMSSTHGGIFYQQSVVKSCYGGDITADMEKEMTSTIAKVPPGQLAYIRYRSLGVFDVKGGNPELPRSQYAQIIASFPQDPAITGFTSVPLWQVVPVKFQAAVKAAIDQYTTSHQVAIGALISQIEAKKLQSYKSPQNVYVYGQQTEQLGSIIHWNNCPYVKEGGNYYTPRCTVPFPTADLNSGQTSTIVNTNYYNEGLLHYETQRDAGTGTMRIYATFHPFASPSSYNTTVLPYSVEIVNSRNDPSQMSNFTLKAVQDSIIQSPWQHTGCVSLDYLYLTTNRNYKVYFTACIDCLPIVVPSPARYGLKNSDLQCVCPGF